MKKYHIYLAILISSTMFVTACSPTQTKEALLDGAANLVIQKYENASCEEVAQMQPQSAQNGEENQGPDAELQKKAIEVLKNNPEMREQFINRVAGPIANKMFECNLVP